MMVEADRLDRLRRAKLRALTAARWAVPDDAVETGFPSGATLTDPSAATTWVLAEDRPEQRLGGALAVALRAGSTSLDVIVDTDAGAAAILARRATHLHRIDTTVWIAEGTDLRRATPAEPAADPVPAPAAELYRPVLEEAGLEVVVEDGELRGEILGLEAARVVIDPDGTARLEAGVGRFDREAGAMMRSDLTEVQSLQVVADLIRPVRRVGAEHHPMNRLVRERWLRTVLVRRPDLIDVAELRPVGSAVPRRNLREAGVATAVGHDLDGEPVVVSTSVGVNLDLVPTAIDDRLTHGPDARLIVVTPASDAAPITGELVTLADDVDLRIVPDDWPTFVGPDT